MLCMPGSCWRGSTRHDGSTVTNADMKERNVRMDIGSLLAAYRKRATTPRAVVAEIRARIESDSAFCAWIHVLAPEQLEPYLLRLESAAATPAVQLQLPLYGIPFAIKDNIDLVGVPTTAACPAFSYDPVQSARAVELLIAAGAIPIGKTNLDQFATGLVGTRSPYGVCRNSQDPAYISGGSSAGSAVAVARGHVSFSLGTDTAGSGRVPAALNGLVGWKPSKGLVSARGVVPACQSLDCVSVFTSSVVDARCVSTVLAEFDAGDPYARAQQEMPWRARPMANAVLRVGVAQPEQLQWFGSGTKNAGAARRYAAACDQLRAAGRELIELDISALLRAGQLLYGDAWLAERWLAVRETFARSPEAIHPVLREILPPATRLSAADAFAGLHELAALQQTTNALLATVDVLMLPTVGGAFTIEEVLAEPVLRNAELGRYTTFANLLDLAVLAVPVGQDAAGLPFGVSFMQRAGSDAALFALGQQFLMDTDMEQATTAAAPERIELAVCGAHMSGLPLNHELTRLGGVFVRATRTARAYQLYALAGTPARPGMVRVADSATSAGAAIALEIWSLPAAAIGGFLLGIPSPLGVGRVQLEDGGTVLGFLCEAAGVVGAQDISAHGGWRAYLG